MRTLKPRILILLALASAVIVAALVRCFDYGLILLVAVAGPIVVRAIKSPSFHERGHFLISFLPWAQIVADYTFAFYVRLGFGSWPRSCIDDPQLPLIRLDSILLLFSIAVLTGLPVLWTGWLVLRWRRGLRRRWLPSTLIFASGILVLLALHWFDPWRFWEWVLD